MNIPKDLNYAKTHEWVKVTGSTAKIGISDFAQHELTDIVFAELPKINSALTKGKECAVIESVKTAADVYSPLSGRVIKINQKVADAPEILNNDPYGDGWLFEIEISNSEELNELLTADEYKAITGSN
jgi:glycine cleavage system H protein